ncbi:hypothetical protein SLE2022_397520 [Rubroshorea leprosula]
MHIPFSCTPAARVWFVSRLVYQPLITSIFDFTHWWKLVHIQWGITVNALKEEIACLCWYIWMNRNQYVFQGFLSPSHVVVVQRAVSLVLEFQQAKGKYPITPPCWRCKFQREERLLQWKPPPKGIIKCNTDEAMNLKGGQAGIAVMCRYGFGCLLDGSNPCRQC